MKSHNFIEVEKGSDEGKLLVEIIELFHETMKGFVNLNKATYSVDIINLIVINGSMGFAFEILHKSYRNIMKENKKAYLQHLEKAFKWFINNVRESEEK